MAAPTITDLSGDLPSEPPLGECAQTILRHYRDQKLGQMVYELPAVLLSLFEDSRQCEEGEAELERRGLVELGRAAPRHLPVNDRVVAAALTLEGERYIRDHDL